MAISNTNRYRVFLEAIDKPALADDPRFAENKDRVANDEALRAILEDILTEKTTAEWEQLLIPQGVTVSAINDVAQVKERFPEAFVEVDHPAAGPGPSARLTLDVRRVKRLIFQGLRRWWASTLQEILAELGY